jgi:hypothetical protein
MALSARSRRAIAARNFALPNRRYPIHTRANARSALARVAQHGTRAEQIRVQRAVARKWPSIRVTKGPTGHRRHLRRR